MLNYKMLVVVLLLVPVIHSRVILPERHASQSGTISTNGEFGLPLNVQEKQHMHVDVNDITDHTSQQGMVNIILKAICAYHRRIRTTPFPTFCYQNFSMSERRSIYQRENLNNQPESFLNPFHPRR